MFFTVAEWVVGSYRLGVARVYSTLLVGANTGAIGGASAGAQSAAMQYVAPLTNQPNRPARVSEGYGSSACRDAEARGRCRRTSGPDDTTEGLSVGRTARQQGMPTPDANKFSREDEVLACISGR